MPKEPIKTEVIAYDDGGRAEIQTLRGEYDGRWTVFYKDGSKSWERFHKNGQKNGPDRSWYKNGSLEYERYYKEEKLHGSWKTWHKNGRLKSEMNFENGIQTGTNRWFLTSGEVLAEMMISSDGTRTGTQIAEFMHSEGLRLGIAKYDNGQYLGCDYFEELPEGYSLEATH